MVAFARERIFYGMVFSSSKSNSLKQIGGKKHDYGKSN
jgi:hypothetical protein